MFRTCAVTISDGYHRTQIATINLVIHVGRQLEIAKIESKSLTQVNPALACFRRDNKITHQPESGKTSSSMGKESETAPQSSL
jgi:hypothetical protein